MHSIEDVMNSRNVAVIGASRDPLKPGAQLLKFLKDTGFQGKMAGINPKGGEIDGIPLYPGLAEVPFTVDLAVMHIPAQMVPKSLADCHRKGVKGVVISSEGFAETGEQGRRYQEEVRKILKATGMRGFGPNTLGLVNTATGLTTSIFTDERMLKPGSIGIATQSGIFIGALMGYIVSMGALQISKALGIGNKVDVDESDALEYFIKDEQTRFVGMYLEDIRDGRRFLELARQMVRDKPVVILKGGRSAAGARATASHTASLAVDDVVLEGALRQAGIIRVKDIEDFLGTLTALQWMPLPKGGRIALVTYSGAQAIMSIDAATEEGLELAGFSDGAGERIAGVIATPSKSRNPIDLYPDMMAHGFEKTATEVMRALLEDEGVDAVVFIGFGTPEVEQYRPIVKAIREQPTKPVLFSLLGRIDDSEMCRIYLRDHRIPSYSLPESAIRVLGHLLRYAKAIRDF
ncbi:acetate--CoA ligase family protein [Thermodesulfobacteriota bacterium]